MCLAIPGEVTETHDREGVRYAKVRFGGVSREVCVQALPEVAPGDFVLVHVGFAIAQLDAAEAIRTLDLLRELGQGDEDFELEPA